MGLEDPDSEKHSEKAQPVRPGSPSFSTTTQVQSTKNIVEHSNYQDTSLSHHPEAYRRQNGQLFPDVASKKEDSRDPFHKIMQDIREFKELLLHRNEIKDLLGRASVNSQPYVNNDWVTWSLLVSLSIGHCKLPILLDTEHPFVVYAYQVDDWTRILPHKGRL